MEEKEIIEKILDKIISGEQYTLTTQEQNALLKLAGNDPAKIEDTLGLNYQEFQAILDDGIKGASNSSSFLERMERRARRGELTEELAAGFNVVKDLIGIGASAKQIRDSNLALGQLSAPAPPTPPGEDNLLSQAISEAQRGTLDAGRSVEASRAGINDQYLRDIALARDISQGQSGTYGALGQVAGMRRNRAFSELAPMIDSIRARESARLDNLIQSRMDSRQQNFANRMSLYNNALNQYNLAQQSAGQQGMIGRENLYGSIGNLANNLAVYGGTYATKNYTGNPYIDEFDAKVNSELSKLKRRRSATTPPMNINYRPSYSPFNSQQQGTV